MAAQKRKATATAPEEPTAKRGREWSPRTRHEKRIESAKPVLETPELLEAILSRLPMTDLFIVQRVCKVWQHSIKNSKSIRKKMFLEPCAPALKPTPIVGGKILDSPMYFEALRPNPAAKVMSVKSNFAHPEVSRIGKGGFGAWAITPAPGGPTQHALHFLGNPNCAKEGSWLDTFLTQPPTVAVSVSAPPEPDANLPEVHFQLYNPKGLTCRNLYQCMFTMDWTPERMSWPSCYLILDDASQRDEVQYAWEHCKGHKDWDGLCGCAWVFKEEEDYE